MPTIDPLSKELFRDSNVFADAINGHFFHGEQIVKPESLSDLDPTETILPKATGKNAPQEFRRDLLKLLTCKKDGDTTYVILGLEEQTSIDYAMPSRVWLYDAVTLYREIRARANFNRKHRKKESNKHFTSKLLPGDRVNAVITLVVYLSHIPWDGPRRISDLVNPIPEGLAPYFKDYKLNLLCPNDLSFEDIHRFKSDLAAVLAAAKYANAPEYLCELMQSDSIFRDITNSSTEPLIESISNVNFNHPTEENTEMGINLAEKVRKMGSSPNDDQIFATPFLSLTILTPNMSSLDIMMASSVPMKFKLVRGANASKVSYPVSLQISLAKSLLFVQIATMNFTPSSPMISSSLLPPST